MTEVHVFGVAGADVAAPPGARTIAHGDLAAIVTDAAPATAAAELLRAHSRILQAVAEQATVVPVRFGTAMTGDDAVVDQLLRPQHDELVAVLARLDGKVQLTVKAFYAEEALLRGVVAGSPAIAKLRERVRALPEAAGHFERIRLGELVAAEVDRARERDAALIRGRLEPLAAATAEEPPSTPDCAAHLALLVERDRVELVSRAVTALKADLAERMELRYLGPLPPYSFAGEASAREAAWA